MRARAITVEEQVTDIETAVATERARERARCAAVVRELARAHAVHAAVARHCMRIAASVGNADQLMRKGQRLKELLAGSEAFAVAIAAIEEEPGA